DAPPRHLRRWALGHHCEGAPRERRGHPGDPPAGQPADRPCAGRGLPGRSAGPAAARGPRAAGRRRAGGGRPVLPAPHGAGTARHPAGRAQPPRRHRRPGPGAGPGRDPGRRAPRPRARARPAHHRGAVPGRQPPALRRGARRRRRPVGRVRPVDRRARARAADALGGGAGAVRQAPSGAAGDGCLRRRDHPPLPRRRGRRLHPAQRAADRTRPARRV
ncbi:MAG: AmfC protein, partial [uncultured Frankineae bacterium]